MPIPRTASILTTAGMLTATLAAAPAHASPTTDPCTLLTETATSSAAVAPRIVATAPGAVENLAVTAGDASAALTWNPPLDTGDLPLTGYYLPLRTTAGIVAEYSAPPTSLGCTLTGLTNGTLYSISVYARNVIGLSPFTSRSFTPQPGTSPAPITPTSPATPPAVPDNPTTPDPYTSSPTSAVKHARVRLTAPKHQPGHRLTLRWVATHASQVRLTWKRGNGKAHSQLTTPTGRITLAGPPGTTYRVTAIAGSARAHKIYRIK